jgi:hypothetical protein
MHFKREVLLCVILTASVCTGATPEQPGPHFADLAVLLAKGWFGSYVAPDAPLNECVAFLNRQGVCFSVFDVMDPHAKVTKEDFARAVGQSTLLLKGEAELENGCIKKPLEAKSWVDYCLLNDVKADILWDRFVERAAQGSVSEVTDFFGNQDQTRNRSGKEREAGNETYE